MCVHFGLRCEALKATVAAMLDTAAVDDPTLLLLQSFATESEMYAHNQLVHRDDKKICILPFTSGSKI